MICTRYISKYSFKFSGKLSGVFALLLSSNACFYTDNGPGGGEGSNSGAVGPSFSITDQFSISAGANSRAHALDYSADGDLAVAGTAENAVTNYQWVVREKADGQGTFSTLDTYQLSAGKNASAHGLDYDSSNLLWAAGTALDATLIPHWIVRKEAANGSWSTSDNYQLSAGFPAMAKSVLVKNNGDIVVAGMAMHSTGNQHAIVRLYSAAVWSTLDDFVLSAGEDSIASQIVQDSVTGDLVVIGHASDGADWHWFARRYSGGSWTTIDNYQLSNNKDAFAKAAAFTSSGHLLIAGQAKDASNKDHWIIRKQAASNPVGALSLADQFQFASGENSFADGIAYSASDNIVYFVGHSVNGDGTHTWVVRSSSNEGGSFDAVAEIDGSATVSYAAFGAAVSPDDEVSICGMLNNGTNSQWIATVLE